MPRPIGTKNPTHNLGAIMLDIISEQDARDAFYAYLDAALWTGLFQPTEDGEPEPLDSVATVDAIPADAREEFLTDWLAFVGAEYVNLREYMAVTGRDLSDVAHDFHLNRNGHGTGFWDRGAGDVGERLNKAAHAYGAAELYAYPGENDSGVAIYVTN